MDMPNTFSRSFSRSLSLAIVSAFVVTACATNPDGSFKLDEKAKGALIGAAAGCALASATGHDCATGAVVGAVAGFMVSWYFESKKLADAKQVNAEYKKQKVDVPKNEIKPVAFASTIKPGTADASGQREVQVTSNTDLIGYGDKAPEMQQKYALYDENNKLVEEKTEKIAAVDGAGRYQTNSKFKLPANAKGKKYTLKTTLVANNKAYKETTYPVSLLDDGRIVVASLN